MRLPDVFSVSDIADWNVSEEYEPGRWRPARQCPYEGFRLRDRLRIAWRVFIGRYDALNWGDHSGEWDNSQVNYRDRTEKGFIRSGNEADSAPTSEGREE